MTQTCRRWPVMLAIAAGWCSLAISQTATLPAVSYGWSPIPIVAGGYVPGIVFHPAQKGLIYARTDIGGAYRWDDAVHRWAPLLDWLGFDEKNDLGVDGLAVDAKDPKRLYLLVGEYTKSWAPNGELFRSEDQGRSFQRTKLPFKVGGNEDGRGGGPRLVVDPEDEDVLYAGTRHDGLWRSLDRGVTFVRVDGFPADPGSGVGVLAVLPMSGGTVVVGKHSVAKSLYVVVSSKDGGLFHSGDGGVSWDRVAKQPRGLMITNTAMTANGVLYLSYGDAPGPGDETDGAVWRVELASGKWNDITPMHPNAPGADGTAPKFGYGGVAVGVDHPETVYASTLDRYSLGDTVYRSTDGGRHWSDIANGQQPRFVGLSPWMNHATPAHGTGSWPSTVAIDPFEANHVLVGTGETIWDTREVNAVELGHPVRWTIGANGIEETAVFALLSPPSGPHLISAVADIGGFRHDDLSVSPKGGSFKNPEFASTTSIAYAAKDPRVMTRVGFSWTGTVYGATSDDQGVTWTPFASQPAGTKGLGSMALTADGKTILWAGDGAAVSVSSDGGRRWKPVPGVASTARTLADPVNAAKLYLYNPVEGTVLMSNDSGANFKPMGAPLPRLETYEVGNIYAVPGREGDLWVSNERGLFHASAGEEFTRMNSVEMARALGFGMPAPEATMPTLFLFGRVQGLTGTFASLDEGKSWIRIDDAAHRFGNLQVVAGDPRIFGRVYVGTEGRGIFGGEPLRSQAKP